MAMLHICSSQDPRQGLPLAWPVSRNNDSFSGTFDHARDNADFLHAALSNDSRNHEDISMLSPVNKRVSCFHRSRDA